MKYKDFLSTNQKAQAAFRASFVDHVPSPLADEDFPDLKKEFNGVPQKEIDDFVDGIIAKEIDIRKKFALHREEMDKLEEQVQPQKEFQKKVAAILPTVNNYMSGNLDKGYDQHERAILNQVAKDTVERFGDQFKLDEDGNIIAGPDDTVTGSELEKLLKRSSVTFLNPELSPMEMVLRTINDNGYGPMMK